MGDLFTSVVGWAEAMWGQEATPFVREVVTAQLFFGNIVLIAQEYAEEGDQDAIEFLAWHAQASQSQPDKPDNGGTSHQ
jgi:hypothetical protein